ncbi:hypothetical protein HN51_056348 [Arachis hypogaea]
MKRLVKKMSSKLSLTMRQNYKVVGEMLTKKRNKLFWMPCTAYYIDLMLKT